MAFFPFFVRVRREKQTIFVEADPALPLSMAIATLCEILGSDNPDNFRLFHNSRLLIPARSIASYNIACGDELQLSVKEGDDFSDIRQVSFDPEPHAGAGEAAAPEDE
jgi:hypothetical protein